MLSSGYSSIASAASIAGVVRVALMPFTARLHHEGDMEAQGVANRFWSDLAFLVSDSRARSYSRGTALDWRHSSSFGHGDSEPGIGHRIEEACESDVSPLGGTQHPVEEARQGGDQKGEQSLSSQSSRPSLLGRPRRAA